MSTLTFKKDTHQYFIGKEEKYSVSKILSNYLGNEFNCKDCNSECSNCQCIMGDCRFCTNVKKACLKGSAVHKVAELYFKNIDKENIVQKIKTKILPLFSEEILKYCFTLLDDLKENIDETCKIMSEKPIWFDIVAGTPDLIYENEDIYDFKTSRTMTTKQLHYAKLQLTAYYWIRLKNGFYSDDIAIILHINEKEVKEIEFNITKELLTEWEKALNLFKEKLKNEYTSTV